ncbi:HAMP domain-containing protein [Agrobacterium vitis]|uniref:histidine kinase n=1 Tax=Agrobacterium vitis TaxID=373 RepID=A0AAE4WEG7_AGRVI|nr:ATP-binding protein [Agrobacterium vitis]MCF1498880.1 HAMP domain-containing protein [Allorhizobium sp. Av2]MCM2441218.1 HAMP domain-containing protein [Agrobacterium vitis]MUZ58398.1 HAMP domain-containing protein [Agrobacterium vitis]MVA65908.1 HAMP domain-containing protein [Agrobacterium vitis]MVA88070.1 HAMP domain-containing protein [Agrobacterium vitis]
MPRLFWRFFVIVWLTITLTTMLGISLPRFNGQLPPHMRIAEVQNEIIAAQIAEMLQRVGPQETQAFIHSITPTGDEGHFQLQAVPAAAPQTCAKDQFPGSIAISYANQCYTLTIDESSISNDWPLVLPWLIGLVASLFSAYLLTKYLLTPIERLRHGLKMLAEGHFSIRIHDPVKNRKDEIGILTQHFDISAMRLQELHESRERLFHDISHELRSPLSRLQAVTGILRKNPVRLPGLLDRMDHEIERLDRLVGEILTMARLSSKTDEENQLLVIDILDILDEIVQDATFEAQEKAVSIDFQRSGSFVAAVNGELIYRAIENVLRNAIKYTGEATVIRISATVSPNGLTLTFTDEGPGVKEDDLESIFRPFISSGSSGSASGYGLGLAIAKTAVERHGGKVFAGNVKPKGLRITMILPGDSDTRSECHNAMRQT